MKNLIAQAQAWWSSISQREQRLVMGGSIIAVLGIIYCTFTANESTN